MSDLFQTLEPNSSQVQELVLDNSDGLMDDFLNPKAKVAEIIRQLNWIITQRRADYLVQTLNLNKHKSVQVRRKVASLAGVLGKFENLQFLQEWQVQESDRQTWLILDSAIDRIRRSSQGHNLEVNSQILSVTEALSQVKRILSEKTYIIEGEVNDLRLIREKMYYFSLKDSEEGRLDCWAFASKVARAGFPLNEGLGLRVHGQFKLSKNSRLYLDIQKIELTGEGELLRNLQLLEEKLRQEGLFDLTRKRKLKKIPRRILLLASPSSAAVDDFQKVLERRIGGIKIYFLPIKTQGVGAEFEVLSALQISNELISKFNLETVILTRGGGAKDDLSIFNSERIVRAIHSLKAPSIVAIGHERDITLAELVADVRASTPSQAAELTSLSKSEIDALKDTAWQSIYYSINQKISDNKQNARIGFEFSKQIIQKKLSLYRSFINHRQNFFINRFYQTKGYLESLFMKILQSSIKKISVLKDNLRWVEVEKERLSGIIKAKKIQVVQKYSQSYSIVTEELNKKKQLLTLLDSIIQTYDPKKTLERGYSLVWQDGKIITKGKDLKKYESLQIEFNDGTVKIEKNFDRN